MSLCHLAGMFSSDEIAVPVDLLSFAFLVIVPLLFMDSGHVGGDKANAEVFFQLSSISESITSGPCVSSYPST